MANLWISTDFAAFSHFFRKSRKRNNLVECPVLLYNKLENYPSKRYITPFFPYISLLGDGGTLLWLKRIKNILTGSTSFLMHWLFIVPFVLVTIFDIYALFLKTFSLVLVTGGSCGNIRVYFLFWFLYTLFYMQSLFYINQKDFKIGLQSMRISLRRIPLEWFSSLYI